MGLATETRRREERLGAFFEEALVKPPEKTF